MILLVLEFDKQSGTVKRTKLVTESEIISRQLSKFKLQPEIALRPNTQEFQLGQKETSKPKEEIKEMTSEIRLRRLRLPQN